MRLEFLLHMTVNGHILFDLKLFTLFCDIYSHQYTNCVFLFVYEYFMKLCLNCLISRKEPLEIKCTI